MEMKDTKALFDSREFEAAYHTEAPLGVFCGEAGTEFRLWAPTAESVVLRLYETGDGGAPLEILHPEKKEKGTWECRTSRNLDGRYYDYAITVEGNLYETTDPWARSCGINGQRSMVLDLSRTDPPGWETDKAPAPQPEQVIYELHVRDFSWDPSGGFAPSDRGRYSALTRLGTTLNRDGTHPTGLSYLKNLGVTHIQLMPVYDYGSVDERDPASGYNWGYDPVNYNIPEGSYSSDPYHGEVRVRELKEMIAALHANGFRVIMDVVYNHTYSLDSNLFKTCPWYFYRQTPEGKPSNGSGCGNDIASERSMCARYILESALYWIEEYHMDGFRFDLMGLLDDSLMNRLQKALDEKYGPGEKLIYGEPWRAADTHPRPGTLLCDKGSLLRIDPRIGAFSDDTRDAVKGSVMDAGSLGFVNGGGIRAETLGKCLTGWVAPQGVNQTPWQTITYLSCHDDWTLWDKLVYTMDPKKNFLCCGKRLLEANRLAAAINFCCQGRPFFLAGEEFGRTKGGIKNSYCSSSEVNRLDWTRAWKNKSLVDYYRGLIGLRKQLRGVTDKSEAAKDRLLWTNDCAPNCAAACLDNRGGDSPWTQVLMIFNCGADPRTLNLPEGKWQLLCDGHASTHWQKETILEKNCTVKEHTALLLGLRLI